MFRNIIRYHSKARVPPKSLLKKQAIRINKKNPDGSNLIITSLRDIVSLFQANSQTQEDDELEEMNHKAYLTQQIQSGELLKLLHEKFQLDERTQLLSTDLLVKNFPSLTKNEFELVEEANELDNRKSWSQIPNHMKQLQYYLSFGSYGPRKDLPFSPLDKPLDFTFLHPSKAPINDATCTYKKLKKNEMVNLYRITPFRKTHFSDKAVDPVSKFFIWSAIGVSGIIGWKEWNLHKKEDSSVTVMTEPKFV